MQSLAMKPTLAAALSSHNLVPCAQVSEKPGLALLLAMASMHMLSAIPLPSFHHNT